MYEILIKWALETVQKIGLDHDKAEGALLMEAIKVKNSMVLRRFDFAWKSCQELIELSQRIDKRISDLELTTSGQDLVDEVCRLHVDWYFEFKKIRPQFEAINDLLSYYSLYLGKLLEIDNFDQLISKRGKSYVEFIKDDYHRLWYFSSAILLALVRITSTDLRFWLSEIDYSQVANKWSSQDVQNMKDHVIDGKSAMFLLRLEQPGELDRFWEEVKDINAKS